MTTHRFSRRTMLRGLGVTMALPWFESLCVWGDEPGGNQKSSEAPVRLAVLFAGNGFHGKEWWAKGDGTSGDATSGDGASMELGQVLAPLNDFREKMLFIRGLYNEQALKGNIHSSQTGNLLSGTTGLRRRNPFRHERRPVARAELRPLDQGAKPRAWVRKVEPIGSQELLDVVQLAHFVDFADNAHAAGTVSRAGVRPALQG